MRVWTVRRMIPMLLLAACVAPGDESTRPATLRVALFNVRELSTAKLEEVDASGGGRNEQLAAAAEIVRRVAPDVLVLQEIDHDYSQPDSLELNAQRFRDAYLRHGGADPLRYPHLFAAPCNTGVPSGHDLNRDGRVAGEDETEGRAYGEDSFGFGTYRGQYAMALLSRYPLAGPARTFQELLWKDLPGHHLPADYYGDAAGDLRLSSKSHWDVPITVAGRVLHLWISHPTPPVFDGEEDRNGRRNFDEIGFWVAYLDNTEALVDDAGRRGGYGSDEPFLIAGDLNADPRSREAFYDGRTSVDQLLSHPRLRDTGDLLTAAGGLGERAPGPPDHPERFTAVFSGGMRLDYLLPGNGARPLAGGVFWPAANADPEGHRLAETASDHRLVWLDLELP